MPSRLPARGSRGRSSGTCFGELALSSWRPRTDSAPSAAPDALTLALVTVGFADLDACAGPPAGSRRAWRYRCCSRSASSPGRSTLPRRVRRDHRSHHVVRGDDPFGGLGVADQDLRRASEVASRAICSTSARNYLERSGEPAAIARVVEASAWLRGAAANVARLDGARPTNVCRAVGAPDAEVASRPTGAAGRRSWTWRPGPDTADGARALPGLPGRGRGIGALRGRMEAMTRSQLRLCRCGWHWSPPLACDAGSARSRAGRRRR